jgi:ATP-binding cassette subfamily C (CFTR/MRP) protein 1
MQKLVQIFAQVEQEMVGLELSFAHLQNAVERVQHYNELESEAAPLLSTDPEPEAWPVKGAVEFRKVELKYRLDLPLVLKGITFSIKAGEKVGIIGRTGAGKSSIAQALFRTVEICGGTIEVDGLNISGLGLESVSLAHDCCSTAAPKQTFNHPSRCFPIHRLCARKH